MKSLNLFMLTRITDARLMSRYHAKLAETHSIKWTNAQEAESLCAFVRALLRAQPQDTSASLELLDGFYFSYTIKHISKEFDLLKIAADREAVLNIELKSEDIGEDRIRHQLLQNRYYLGHISQKIHSYTYVSSSNTLYYLNNHDYLVKCDLQRLIRVLSDSVFRRFFEGNLDDFFDVAGYVISPINTPERFLSGEYFLTNQQWDIRRYLLKALKNRAHPCLFGISGGPGTGKTLLLYDLAVVLSRKKTVCILHCGPLYEGHRLINRRMKNLQVISIKINDPLEQYAADYDYFMIDETGRLSYTYFDRLVQFMKDHDRDCIFCYDDERLQFSESESAGTDQQFEKCCDQIFKLTGNVRINPSLASFWSILYNRKITPKAYAFPDVELAFAHNRKEMENFSSYYKQKHYQVIDADCEPVIGREFDKVCMILDKDYFYDQRGHLAYSSDPDINRKALALLYDGVTRAREKLSLIIVRNKKLLDSLLESMKYK